MMDTTGVTVVHGDPVSIELLPDGAEVMSGYTETYTVMAYDASGNSWDVTTESNIDTNDPCGDFAGDEFLACRVGDWTQSAAYEGLTDEADVTVVHGDAVSVELTPDGAEVMAGYDQAYTLMAYDVNSNAWDVTAESTFSTTDPLGAFAANVFTGGQVGDWVQTGTYDSLMDDADVTVVHGDAVSIELTPDGETVRSGDSLAYSVMAEDAFGNTWDATDEASYATTDPCGVGFMDNVYYPCRAGDWVQTATYEGASDDADVTVLPGTEITSLEIGHIDDQIVKIGFTVVITTYNGHGNIADFDGEVVLTTNISGTDTIEPDVLSCVDGYCTGEVAISTWQDDVVITATAGGMDADSNLFDVKPRNLFLPFIVRMYVVED
jgi:hypothetical protein